ncbi:MAG: glycoside hydrolase family 2 TIM barrel-domain containing protein [Bacteroidota bacterium]|nr:glycoside hydrolase family 2 TIM barrel-domain containing protein [Bacteroidota bacterium]
MGILKNSSTRSVIDLNGVWRYRTLKSESWYTVTVPSSFIGSLPVIFSKSFEIAPELLARASFHFVALQISYYSEISINGHFIGKHAGETSFTLKIPNDVLHAGQNEIVVLVHNTLSSSETIPVEERLWDPVHFGGILQDIAIIATGPVWVQETILRPIFLPDGKSVTLSYRTLINSSSNVSRIQRDSSSNTGTGKTTFEHTLEVFDAQTGGFVARSVPTRFSIAPDRMVSFSLMLDLSQVKFWSPENPYLYIIVQKIFHNGILIDEAVLQTGFRFIRSANNRLSLNGSQISIRGVTYYGISGSRGSSMSIEEIEKDVLIMKNLGANAVRLMNGSVHPMFYSFCDKYGLLVFQDMPVSQVPSPLLSKWGFLSIARNVVRDMLVKYAYHPCIVAVGLARSIDWNTEGYSPYLSEMSSVVKTNSDLLVYASFLFPGIREIPTGLDFSAVDIPPCDMKRLEVMWESLDTLHSSGQFLIGSIYYPVEINNNNGINDPRSLDAQAQFVSVVYSDVVKRKLPGVFFHSFCDYPVSIPFLTMGVRDQRMASVGFLDILRHKRIAYDILKARFNDEKSPSLVVANFNEEFPIIFVIIGLLLIAIFASMYNIFRRFRENISRSLLRPYNFYCDIRDRRVLSIFQTTSIGFLGCLTSALLFANILFSFRTNFAFDEWLSVFIPSMGLKSFLVFNAWNPFTNILLFACVLFFLLIVFAILIRIVALMRRKSLTLFDTYSAAMWSVIPILFLLPLGLVLTRLLSPVSLTAVFFSLIVVFHFWVFSRLLKGAAILLESKVGMFYFIGYITSFLVVFVTLWVLDSRHETFFYIQYMIHKWLPVFAHSHF